MVLAYMLINMIIETGTFLSPGGDHELDRQTAPAGHSDRAAVGNLPHR
jgi:hypothetical protein